MLAEDGTCHFSSTAQPLIETVGHDHFHMSYLGKEHFVTPLKNAFNLSPSSVKKKLFPYPNIINYSVTKKGKNAKPCFRDDVILTQTTMFGTVGIMLLDNCYNF